MIIITNEKYLGGSPNNMSLSLYTSQVASGEGFRILDEKYKPVKKTHPPAMNLVSLNQKVTSDKDIEKRGKNIGGLFLDDLVSKEIEKITQPGFIRNLINGLKDLGLYLLKQLGLVDPHLINRNPKRYYDIVATVYFDNEYRPDLAGNEVLVSIYRKGLMNPKVKPHLDTVVKDLENTCKNANYPFKTEYL